MEIFANDGGLPSASSIKDVSAKSTTLKINIASLPIEVALKDFINYDKVAIITRHSIRGDDTSASGPLTDLGKTAAENLGKKLKDIFGQKNVKFFATDTVRTKDTCNFINKGWNSNQSPVIDVSKNIINGNYFNVSGSWHDITTISKTTAIKNKVAEWKNLFYNEMPDGISWWVSHDSFLVPIIYNTDNFNPLGLKDLLKLSSDPWISPLTGIIVGIKNNSVKLRIVTGLETGAISGASNNLIECAFEENKEFNFKDFANETATGALTGATVGAIMGGVNGTLRTHNLLNAGGKITTNTTNQDTAANIVCSAAYKQTTSAVKDTTKFVKSIVAA